MKIININNDVTFKAGSSLQGYMSASYDELVAKFGEPTYKAEKQGDFDKVWTEWVLEFEVEEDGETDYIYATIYDWKESSPEASRTGKQYRWHIGGFSWAAEDAVGTAFNEEKQYA